MTQGYSSNVGHASNVTGTGNPTNPEVGELLDQVCGNALRFLADTPRLPRHLRMRAGEVSVDIEWAELSPAPVGGAAGSAVPVPTSTTDAEASGGYLTAPTVGVFYRAPEAGAAPFVSEGDTVIPSQQVGIIEAMKLMIPVEADRAGRIAAVLKDNAEPVEYGDRLFALTTVDTA